MTSFTSRYGDPAVDYLGAHIWGHCRHTATVVSVAGRVDSANLAVVTESTLRFISPGSPFVLDVSGLTRMTPDTERLLDAVDDRCRQAGVDWALVAVDSTAAGGAPASARGCLLARSVAEAENHFDDGIRNRRRGPFPLLRHTA